MLQLLDDLFDVSIIFVDLFDIAMTAVLDVLRFVRRKDDSRA